MLPVIGTHHNQHLLNPVTVDLYGQKRSDDLRDLKHSYMTYIWRTIHHTISRNDRLTSNVWKIAMGMTKVLCITSDILVCPLQWHHNERDGSSNHQPHDCLLNPLFRRRSKKTPKLRVTPLCEEFTGDRWNSPHKGPVTRKMFPFDDVIMGTLGWALTSLTGIRH